MGKTVFEHKTLVRKIIRIVQSDLTQEPVDAIVNAANENLAHGGGVAGAIVRQGGRVIQEESNTWVRQHGPVPTGSGAITGAGDLPARYVIHAVGPVWGSGDEDDKLSGAVYSALALAEERGLASISLPAISAGIFGFPKDRCARVIIEAIRKYLEERSAGSLHEVNICLLDSESAALFKSEAERQLRPAD